jgi:hypothetical protein
MSNTKKTALLGLFVILPFALGALAGCGQGEGGDTGPAKAPGTAKPTAEGEAKTGTAPTPSSPN